MVAVSHSILTFVSAPGQFVSRALQIPIRICICICTMDDKNNIAGSRHNLTGKLNDVLSTFRELDSFVKVRLLKNYCLSGHQSTGRQTNWATKTGRLGDTFRSTVRQSHNQVNLCQLTTVDIGQLYNYLHLILFVCYCLCHCFSLNN